MSEKPAKSNRTTEKLLEIISALDEGGPQGVTELATHLELPKSTVHYHLQVLDETGYVVRENQRYRLGLRFLEIGENTRRRIQLYEAAKEEINQLATTTGELAILMVEEQGLGVYLYKQGGEQAMDVDAPIGRHAYLHDRAIGKAILAHLPDERVEAIIQEHGLTQTTEETISTREELFDSLERIRSEEVAYNLGEAVEGLHAVAVPILTESGDVLGGISIAGPARRLEGDRITEEIPKHLFQAKNVIELKLQKNHQKLYRG
ncbi:IclR family transcriptional regulator [Haloarcula nitratireducens]|uniref:IclR family transcriptional regulator n=1 Tax=Haloarcula nitratireducens TaxID=2487749 RepID=A0AAW4PHH1_9EURY|nr:IclR family transcriptional regulator [Halomicroarcula nitratireducens]MBX0297480.1 IclR family transcriptional regulator [Halomicroarcula nitratireducens]